MKRRSLRFVSLAALVSLSLAGVAAPVLGGSAAAAEADLDSSVTLTKTIARTHLVDGSDVVADKLQVTMTVERTEDLRSRQPVTVTWRGAHPTGRVETAVNSSDARLQEFPFVLLQCRGVDSATAPPAERLSPQTCWTQTAGERMHQVFGTSGSNKALAFPPWRVDRYARAAERAYHVNDPDPPLPNCVAVPADDAVRKVPFVSQDGAVYYPYPSSVDACARPPETASVENVTQPGNTTYGITRPDGAGQTKFTIWTKQDNQSLGCSQEVSCALVAVPVLGVSCDVTAASLPPADRPPASVADAVAKDCMSTGVYEPGTSSTGDAPAVSVSGTLWWAESNWRNRITVPLTFAPADNVCDIVGGKEALDLYGSELIIQAMTQWKPTFCLDPERTPIRHVQVGEPQAANLLRQSSIEAAMVSRPPEGGYRRPVVNAPLGFTGFAIGYAIDGANKAPYPDLRLTPRLLAKLLTMSYPGLTVRDEYDALRTNPLGMAMDPEFQALNPGAIKVDYDAAATLYSLSSDSDVIRALTTYITADAEARAWLDGAPDPWGMTVNPSYRGISLPVQTWPQLDTFMPVKAYATMGGSCLRDSPVPYLPLIASPTIRMSSISQALQFAFSPSQTVCKQDVAGQIEGVKLAAAGLQAPGSRFLLGVTSLGDAARYDLDTAALQTFVAPSADPKLATDVGRTFVAPSGAGLRAAAGLLTPDAATGAWDLPVSTILSTEAAKSAYPGSMVVYASVPTSGLPAADATGYGQFLEYAATTGQVPGTTNGTLAAGYLPLTDENGLGKLAAYTVQAAAAVTAQKGTVPPVVATASTPAPVASAGATSASPAARPAPVPKSTPAPARAPAPSARATPAPTGARASAPATATTAPQAMGAAPGTATPPATASAAPTPTAAAGSSSPTVLGTGAGAGDSGSGSANAATGPDGSTGPPSGGAPVVPAPSGAAPPQPAPKSAGVAAVQAAKRLATLAQEIGVAGAVPAVLLLAALGLGGAVALTLVTRQVRAGRG